MKKAITLLLTIIPSIILLAVLLLSAQPESVLADAAVLYVAPGGACGGSGHICYASIQAAVDVAAPGDEIHIAAGIYTDTHVRPRHDFTTTGIVTQTVYLTKTLTIRGGYSLDFANWDPDAYTTTLDSQGQGRGLYITGNIIPTVEGLQIMGGNALGLGGYSYYGTYDAGGGIYVMTATATLIGNQITGNSATHGGGVFLNNNASLLQDNQVTDNTVTTGGGGISVYRGAPKLMRNTIQGNTSMNLGGGIYLFSTNATLTNNQIVGNSALVLGGGINVASCNPQFSSNIIASNSAMKGGGIYLWYSASTLTNNVISDNQATGSGSGIYIGGSTPVMLHTTFARNTGGNGSGVFITSDGGSSSSNVAITNTLSISQNIGISITGNSTILIDGILWFGTPITVSEGTATVIVQHQHTGDPAFDVDGYHLTPGSAAIDQGLPAGVLTDVDGQSRPIAIPDLGADEYWQPGSPRVLYLPTVIK